MSKKLPTDPKCSNEIWYSDNPVPRFSYPNEETEARIAYADYQIKSKIISQGKKVKVVHMYLFPSRSA